MMKANLFIAGAVKSGTSSLHYYLSQHPEVSTSIKKEPHFFDTDLHKESDKFHKKKRQFPIRTIRAFEKQFEKNKILAESTPTYILSKVAAKNIKKYNSESKVIIMLREPVSLLYSWHNQLLRNLDEEVNDFEEALSLEKIRLKGKRIPKNVVTPSFVFYSEIINFPDQVERFIREFNNNQLMIILLDELKENPEKVFSRIEDFLGIKHFKIDFSVKNSSKTIKNPLLHKFFYGLKRFPLKDKIPLSSKRFISKLFNKRIFEEAKTPPINKATEAKLKKQFKALVVKTNKILHKHKLIDKDIDLVKLWKY